MENKSHALMAGIFTLALTAAAILIAIWFNRDQVDRVPYLLATKLSITGLNPQAAVRYRGLDVGRVSDIGFDPEVQGQILIKIAVDPKTPITRSTYATLGYQGVTGIAYVDLNDDGSSAVPLDSSEKQLARIEMRPSLLDSLQSKGLAILEKTEDLTARVNDLLSPANQKAMIDAFNNVSVAAKAMESIPAQLEPALAQLPALASEAKKSMTAISRLSDNINGLTTEMRVPNGAIDRIADAADRVGSVADRIELEALPLAQDARSSLRTINRTLENLNERPQGILFGSSRRVPGPGEEGFVAPQ